MREKQQAEKDIEIKRLKEELENSKEIIRDLRITVENQIEQINRLEYNVKVCNQEKFQLEMKNKELIKENNELQKELSTAKREITTWQISTGAVALAGISIGVYEGIILDTAFKRIKDLESEVSRLKDMLETCRSSLKTCNTNYDICTGNLNLCNKDKEACLVQKKICESSLKTCNTNYDTCMTTKTKCISDLERCKHDLKNCDENNNKCHKDFDHCKNERDIYKKDSVLLNENSPEVMSQARDGLSLVKRGTSLKLVKCYDSKELGKFNQIEFMSKCNETNKNTYIELANNETTFGIYLKVDLPTEIGKEVKDPSAFIFIYKKLILGPIKKDKIAFSYQSGKMMNIGMGEIIVEESNSETTQASTNSGTSFDLKGQKYYATDTFEVLSIIAFKVTG